MVIDLTQLEIEPEATVSVADVPCNRLLISCCPVLKREAGDVILKLPDEQSASRHQLAVHSQEAAVVFVA